MINCEARIAQHQKYLNLSGDEIRHAADMIRARPALQQEYASRLEICSEIFCAAAQVESVFNEALGYIKKCTRSGTGSRGELTTSLLRFKSSAKQLCLYLAQLRHVLGYPAELDLQVRQPGLLGRLSSGGILELTDIASVFFALEFCGAGQTASQLYQQMLKETFAGAQNLVALFIFGQGQLFAQFWMFLEQRYTRTTGKPFPQIAQELEFNFFERMCVNEVTEKSKYNKTLQNTLQYGQHPCVVPVQMGGGIDCYYRREETIVSPDLLIQNSDALCDQRDSFHISEVGANSLLDSQKKQDHVVVFQKLLGVPEIERQYASFLISQQSIDANVYRERAQYLAGLKEQVLSIDQELATVCKNLDAFILHKKGSKAQLAREALLLRQLIVDAVYAIGQFQELVGLSVSPSYQVGLICQKYLRKFKPRLAVLIAAAFKLPTSHTNLRRFVSENRPNTLFEQQEDNESFGMLMWSVLEKTVQVSPVDPRMLRQCYQIVEEEPKRLQLTNNFLQYVSANALHVCRIPVAQTPDVFNSDASSDRFEGFERLEDVEASAEESSDQDFDLSSPGIKSPAQMSRTQIGRELKQSQNISLQPEKETVALEMTEFSVQKVQNVNAAQNELQASPVGAAELCDVSIQCDVLAAEPAPAKDTTDAQIETQMPAHVDMVNKSMLAIEDEPIKPQSVSDHLQAVMALPALPPSRQHSEQHARDIESVADTCEGFANDVQLEQKLSESRTEQKISEQPASLGLTNDFGVAANLVKQEERGAAVSRTTDRVQLRSTADDEAQQLEKSSNVKLVTNDDSVQLQVEPAPATSAADAIGPQIAAPQNTQQEAQKPEPKPLNEVPKVFYHTQKLPIQSEQPEMPIMAQSDEFSRSSWDKIDYTQRYALVRLVSVTNEFNELKYSLPTHENAEGQDLPQQGIEIDLDLKSQDAPEPANEEQEQGISGRQSPPSNKQSEEEEVKQVKSEENGSADTKDGEPAYQCKDAKEDTPQNLQKCEEAQQPLPAPQQQEKPMVDIPNAQDATPEVFADDLPDFQIDDSPKAPKQEAQKEEFYFYDDFTMPNERTASQLPEASQPVNKSSESTSEYEYTSSDSSDDRKGAGAGPVSGRIE